MNDGPTPLQTLFLWRLLFDGGGAFQGDAKPELPAKDRRALETLGIIETEKRTKASPGKRKVSANYISLTERGWEWAARNLDAEISVKTPASGPILRMVLTRLQDYLAHTGASLADFIVTPTPPSGGQTSDALAAGDAAPSPVSADLVRAAYWELTGHRPARRVRLAELRQKLAGVAAPALDEVLLQMERESTLVLYPLDDPREIQAEDEAAGLVNSAGQKRHVVYMET